MINLNANEREVIVLMARHSMNISRVAKASYCSRKTVYERCMSIENKTGLNPANFWGLKALLESLEKERSERESNAE